MSGRFGHAPRVRWNPANWLRDWHKRGLGDPSSVQLLRRNEIENFRLMLAAKESREWQPKT